MIKMGIDDFCNTGLVLGLGLSSSSSTRENNSKKPLTAQKLNPLSKISEPPSLTLSLSGSETLDHHYHVKKVDNICFHESNNSYNDHDQYQPSADNNLNRQDHSAGSSSLISNVSMKREREMGGGSDQEEVEIERASWRRVLISDDDDDDGSNSNGRKKLRLTKAQSVLLEESFKEHTTLNPKQKQDLARELKLRPRQVEVWFQNRRARTKLKQTEVDCEFFRKWCETLTDENRRLQKELKELKLAKPLYMKLPTATLTMCPSCERVAAGGGPENAAKSPFNMAPKPHFYNPFTNPPSAAC